MNKKYLCGVCVMLLALIIVGSSYVDKSLSSSNYTIDTVGTYYLPKGTNVTLSGISCTSSYDYTSTPPTATMTTDCGGTNFTMPTAQDDYLFIVEDTGSTCSGMMVGAPPRTEAVCKIYPYNAGSVNIQCNKNTINAGDKASCTIRTVTSSDGIKALSFVFDSSDLVIKNFESNFFTALPSGNFYTFVAKKELNTQTDYLVAAFDIENVSVNDGANAVANFNSISYTDNITMLDLGSVSLEFKEQVIPTTTTTTKKVYSGGGGTPTTTTTAETTISTVITAGIDAESPKVDPENKPVVKTEEGSGSEEDKPALNGGAAVALTVFVATMSIATGIGISIIFTKLKL